MFLISRHWKYRKFRPQTFSIFAPFNFEVLITWLARHISNNLTIESRENPDSWENDNELKKNDKIVKNWGHFYWFSGIFWKSSLKMSQKKKQLVCFINHLNQQESTTLHARGSLDVVNIKYGLDLSEKLKISLKDLQTLVSYNSII